MLKNACLVAKIGLDTDENEPSKVWSFSLKFQQHLQKSGKFTEILQNFTNLANFEFRSSAKVCESCRSRKNLMLKNAYLDAKIGVDTAENEPRKGSEILKTRKMNIWMRKSALIQPRTSRPKFETCLPAPLPPLDGLRMGPAGRGPSAPPPPAAPGM